MPSTLGERIRAARHDAEWTLDEAAHKSGLSKGFLSDLENGKRDPSVSTIRALSDSLNVSVEWLVRGHHVRPAKCPMCRGSGKIFIA